jgi:exodeoxyribonuclease V gamma subunit
MGRWLNMGWAARLGVALGLDLPIPRVFAERFLGRGPRENPWTPERLAWRLFHRLADLPEEASFDPVRDYLKDADARKRWALAARLGDLFDRYAMHRPEMVLGWETGEAGEAPHAEWQAWLWRELVERQGNDHAARRWKELWEGAAPPVLAEPLHVFAVTLLPRVYLDVLCRLARNADVHVYHHRASRHFLGDEAGKKLAVKLAVATGFDPEQLEGNPLLGALGRAEASSVAAWLDAVERAGVEWVDAGDEGFCAPPGDGVLAVLQRDLVEAPSRADIGRVEVLPGEGSFAVHRCHSPLREMEVLRDQILAAFEADRELRPRDVMVLVPDIARYTPFIEAVFGGGADPRLPFGIADRTPLATRPAAAAFAQFLELAGSRLRAPDVFGLMENLAVRAQLRLSAGDLDRLREWIGGSGIRWGADGVRKREFDLPEEPLQTWRRGLDRLLLGYASDAPFGGLLPHAAAEGEGELLGRFVAFAEEVIGFGADLGERAVGEWVARFREVLERLVGDGDDEEEDAVKSVRAALARIEAEAAPAEGEAPGLVPFAVMRDRVLAALGEAEARGGFLLAGITFSALQPMRGIPARFVWVAGLDGDAFPRGGTEMAFDLMRADRKPGEVRVSDGDRHAFLEALLSARERLGLSCVGRSVRDDSERAPSVVVSELLDYVALRFGESVREQAVVDHSMQAFGRRYFSGEDPRLFTYSEADASAARAFAGRAAAGPEPLEVAPIEVSDETLERWSNLAPEELERFFKDPAGAFLRDQFGVGFWDESPALEGEEAIEQDALAKGILRGAIFGALLRGDGMEEVRARAVEAGDLAPGGVGEAQWGKMLGEAREVAEMVWEAAGESLAADREIELGITTGSGDYRVCGTLGNWIGDRMVFATASKLTGKHRVAAWVRHLLASSAFENFGGTYLVGREEQGAKLLPPIEPREAARRLGELLDLRIAGLRAPLRFFPRTSWEYANAEASQAGSGMREARKQWAGGDHVPAEAEEPAIRLLWPGIDPLNAHFRNVASRVFRGLAGGTEAAEEPGEGS